jgi:hypothetical protein
MEIDIESIWNIVRRDADIVERLDRAYHSENARGPNEGVLRDIIGHAFVKEIRYDVDLLNLVYGVVQELPAADIAKIAKKAIEPEDE